MDAGSCNACNTTGTPLMKLSLGKDFSDAPMIGCRLLRTKAQNGIVNPAP